MGNGGFCLNTKDKENDIINTLQFPTKEDQKLFANNSTNELINHSNPTINIIYPNYYTNNNNNTNFINTNYRKYFKSYTNKLQDESTNINLSTNINNTIKHSIQTELSPENNFIFLPLGDKYEGEILNNKPHGQGKYYSATGEIRKGSFNNGQLNGKGIMNLINGVY